jgi:molecular chaperone DnaJ
LVNNSHFVISMAHGVSHYELLGVDQQASAEQVKAAYQKLVLTLHPDKAGDDNQERFQQLQQAWQVSSHASRWRGAH